MAIKTCYSRFENLEKYSVRGFKLGAVPQKLTATDRGKLFFIEGGASAADKVYVCIKGTDDKLALKEVGLS
jgi:hypothetical protein